MVDAGYLIYDPSDSGNKFYFDKTLGRGLDSIGVRNENNRTMLKTFGEVPYVYYAGETNFVEFGLSNVFVYNEETGETAREQVDKFKDMVNRRNMLMVENSQGQQFKCDVVIISEEFPKLYTEEDLDYITIEVECTQIDI